MRTSKKPPLNDSHREIALKNSGLRKVNQYNLIVLYMNENISLFTFLRHFFYRFEVYGVIYKEKTV